MAPTDVIFTSSPLAVRMLDDVPGVLTADPDVIAVIYAQAKEIERFDALIETVKNNLWPHTADADGLRWWEAMLDLTIDPEGVSVEDRREIVLTFYRAAGMEGAGFGWEAAVTRVVGDGWYYREHESGHTVPPAYTIAVFVPFPPGSETYGRLRRLLAIITPANLVITVTSQGGFILDESQLDEEGLG